MKKILGLDLGTNSIGWALVDKENQKLLGLGSRIIPMGVDKQDYEKGVGITKNADRRIARSIRKMNKRYKLRRNKLLFIMNELGILPSQFIFKNGIPEATKIRDLEILPIKKGTLQLDSLAQYQLRVKAINNMVEPKEFGKILYQFNQLRGYAGGNNEDENKKKKEDNGDSEEKRNYEVITQKAIILKIEKTEKTFKNKGQDLPQYDVVFGMDENEFEGWSKLQNLKLGEDEFEIRIKRNKKGEESYEVALPQKTNWRKQMETTRDILINQRLTVGQLLLKDLQDNNRWKKIRNRVFLRKFYKDEFDAIWNEQARHIPILNNCPKEIIEKIAWYLFPGLGKNKDSNQDNLRKEAIEGGLKYIIKEMVIYYQRPLKSQIELISNCQFEKNEKAISVTHPLFQEFRCWKQINQLYIRSKKEEYNERKKKAEYKYYDRYLTNEQKESIFSKLQIQKQVGYADIKKIIGLEEIKGDFLNGLNFKAKLKGCDTSISIKKILKEFQIEESEIDNKLIENIWDALYNNTGNEYDEKSPKVASSITVLKKIVDEDIATAIALKLAQSLNFPRKYGSLSSKAINKLLPLMVTNPSTISNDAMEKFEKINHIIDTGEIDDDSPVETYMIDYINYNPDILQTGGMMDSFAASLIYGKHTTETLKPTITNYHDIKYNADIKLRNPVVEQISNETMQVIKAIWKKYKINPAELEIRVELARDLKNSAAEREKIYKGQLNNQKQNDRIKERLQEANIHVTDENVIKYKLFEIQKYISPYSGNTLELSLFNTYQIDHIIPKTRLFDDSISNKVLVEGFLNSEKSNRTAWEYITQQTSKYKIYNIDEYLQNINKNYFGKRKKNLLLEKIPNDFIDRQKKDTQYISVAVKNELSKIVGSQNVKTSTGEVTNFLRSKWGLTKMFMELTEERFKRMELWDESQTWVNRYFDKEKGGNVYEIKNWSKRYDHRHHAIDALVVSLTEQKDINRLNNLNKELQNWLEVHKNEIKLVVQEGEPVLEAFFNLEEKRREEIQKRIPSPLKFDPPISNLVAQAKDQLETMVVSHKPKDKLTIRFNDKSHKNELKIRGALHEATFYGKHNGHDSKTQSISNLSVKDIDKVIDGVLANEIRKHRNKKENGKDLYSSMKEAFSGEGLKVFNQSRFQRKNPEKLKPPVFKVKVRYSKKEDDDSTLQPLYDGRLSVKTGGNYVFLVMEKANQKGIQRCFDIISLFDASQLANQSLKEGNKNFKNKIFEAVRFDSVENPKNILFTLQQNDLVYLPENIDDIVLNFSNAEFNNWASIKENRIQLNKRVYRVVKFSGKDCYFIPHNYATSIIISKDLTEDQKFKIKQYYGEKKIPKKEFNYVEFGSYRDCSPFEANDNFTKSQIDKNYKHKPIKIQDFCIKLKTDWLGNLNLDK